MNQRIKKKIKKRLNQFHYHDYYKKYYTQLLQNYAEKQYPDDRVIIYIQWPKKKTAKVPKKSCLLLNPYPVAMATKENEDHTFTVKFSATNNVVQNLPDDGPIKKMLDAWKQGVVT